MNSGIEKLWEEVRELSLGTEDTRIDRLDSAPTPLQFLRHYVSPNKPCIISNAISQWPALSRWHDTSYLSRSLSHSVVSLHLTPDGRADSLAPLLTDDDEDDGSHCFASAHVERMPFPRALDHVLHPAQNGPVAYLQHQNDCFRTEYNDLAADCDPHIPWATEALGCLPDAVNLWIGNHLSETSFHKDHYENLYAVVSGQKHFLLLPPTDVHRMYIRPYPAAHYSYSHDTNVFVLKVEQPLRYVPWSSVNPFPPPQTREAEMSKFPQYFRGPKPFHCTVKAGEILYLPSMWFHHVRQSPGDEGGFTIAVNYCNHITDLLWQFLPVPHYSDVPGRFFGVDTWVYVAGYDMQFDIKYAYFNFLQSVPLGLQLPGTPPKGLRSHVNMLESGDELCSDTSEVIALKPDQQNGDE